MYVGMRICDLHPRPGIFRFALVIAAARLCQVPSSNMGMVTTLQLPRPLERARHASVD
jgi:hypothetical protein